jgi:hypothetical protein
MDDELIGRFSDLTVGDQKRYLFGYGDTEGAPHRQGSNSNLWNISIIFKYVVDPTGTILSKIFHTCNFSFEKNNPTPNIRIPLQTHLDSIVFLKELYECSDICICFWNAPHDKAVLRHYKVDQWFHTVDLLPIARSLNKNIDNFSVGALAQRFGLRTSERLHTALGDTNRMISLLPFLGISDPKVLVSQIKPPRSKPKTENEKRIDTRMATRKKTENFNNLPGGVNGYAACAAAAACGVLSYSRPRLPITSAAINRAKAKGRNKPTKGRVSKLQK